MECERPKYRHTPLAHPSKQIRLLRLLHAGSDGEIHCRLSPHHLDDDTEFVAVSYTWGPPPDDCKIWIDGAAFLVRPNCWYLLRQALEAGVTDHLWIDAICINQSDDAEKSHQVAMMGDIYRQALRVDISLGPHEDDSEFVFRMIAQHSAFADNTLVEAQASGQLQRLLRSIEPGLETRHGDELPQMCLFPRRVRAQLQYELPTKQAFSKLSTTELRRLTDGFYALSERGYFSRLWIVQEVLLGREVRVLCGESSVDVQAVADFEMDLRSFCSELQRHDGSNVDMETSSAFSNLINFRHRWDGAGTGLMSLTDQFAESKCSDIRDRIFGLLAMVDWKGRDAMLPDYTKSALQVAIQTLVYMCRPQPSSGTDADGTDSDSDFEQDDTTWPIVSSSRIAAALELHGESKYIARLLGSRQAFTSSEPSMPRSCPGPERSKIVVAADAFCELFLGAHTGDDLLACLGRSDNGRKSVDIGIPPGFEEEEVEARPSVPCREVWNGMELCARVTHTALPGDFLLEFHESCFDYGLVVRKIPAEPSSYHVVGQAIFEEGVKGCAGGAGCSCSLDSSMHAQDGNLMEVHFDPQDLLLFVCQTLRVREHRSVDLVRWKEVLAGEVVREAHVGQEGEIVEDSRIQSLRLTTAVVDSEDATSSYAALVPKTGKSGTAADDEWAAQLRELQQHFQQRRS